MRVVPNSLLWIAHRCRTATGRDLLGLQGLHSPDNWQSLMETTGLKEPVLADLAGNAFCSVCIAVAELIVMVVHAHLVSKCSKA